MLAVVEKRRREGLTWRQLSIRSRIPVSTLQWWEKKLRGKKPSRKPSGRGFVELAVVEDESADEQGVEVILKTGRRLRVGSGFDEQHLRRLVRVLEQPC